jgi:peptide/nickel transport system substrate-binding protein/oligopeptide transport system substrate-binding protein
MQAFRLVRQAVLGVTIITLLAVAIGPARATPVRAGGVLVWPVSGNLWPKTLDPAEAVDPTSKEILGLLYNGLVKFDGHNNLVPDLAAALPRLSPDHRTYTFTLRPHLQFSDGSPLTAADVVYSLSRATSQQEGSPLGGYLKHIEGFAAWNAGKAARLAGVRALDARTVQITLNQPTSFFLAQLTDPAFYVIKRNVATREDLTSPGAQARNIGSGPWIFAGPWRYQQEMAFVPNPRWYRAGQIKLAELKIPFITDFETNYREYLAGQVPMTAEPSSHFPADHTLPDFHANPILETDYVAPNLGTDGQCKPVSCAPFNDLHFRRALLYAVDRQAITKVEHGSELPLCGVVPKGLPGYDPGLCPLTPYDPTRARRELALARKDFGGILPNDGQLSMPYPNLGQDVTTLSQELQVEWQAVGISIRIVATPFDQWLTLLVGGSAPCILTGWIADYPDPQDFTENLFGSDSNYDTVHYHNPAFDHLMALADSTPDGPARTNLYIQAQKLLINDAAYIPIGQTVWSFRWRTNIHGFYLSPDWYFPQPVNEDWANVWVG